MFSHKPLALSSLALLALVGGCNGNWMYSQKPEHASKEVPSALALQPDAKTATTPAAQPTGPATKTTTKVALANSTTEHAEPGIMGSSPNGEPEAPAAIENVSRVTFAAEGSDFDPAVSPDGATLVFASTQHRNTADIYVKQVAGKVVTRLTNDPADDVQPAISPDGTHIAFASNRNGNWDIFVMPINGGTAVQVTDEAADELHPSWSPDGKQLVFCRYGQVSGRWELWVTGMSIKSAAPSFIGYGMFPEWCPVAATGNDGAERILFQLGRERGSRAFGIWTLDYKDGQTTNLTEVAPSSTFNALINPTWSPDGRHIVYTQVPAQNAPSTGETKAFRPQSADLYLAAVDGSARVRLTGGPAISMFPRWSGNESGSQTLFFVSDRSGRDNIWSMDLNTALVAVGAKDQPAHAAVVPHAPASKVSKTDPAITIHDAHVAGVDEHTSEGDGNK